MSFSSSRTIELDLVAAADNEDEIMNPYSVNQKGTRKERLQAPIELAREPIYLECQRKRGRVLLPGANRFENTEPEIAVPIQPRVTVQTSANRRTKIFGKIPRQPIVRFLSKASKPKQRPHLTLIENKNKTKMEKSYVIR